jgi:hypothetical protein
VRIHFWSILSDSQWHSSFNKEYTVSFLDSVADPDSHHSEQLDPDPLKEKSQGIRIPVKSWILIRILLQHVLQSETPGAGEALNGGHGG